MKRNVWAVMLTGILLCSHLAAAVAADFSIGTEELAPPCSPWVEDGARPWPFDEGAESEGADDAMHDDALNHPTEAIPANHEPEVLECALGGEGEIGQRVSDGQAVECAVSDAVEGQESAELVALEEDLADVFDSRLDAWSEEADEQLVPDVEGAEESLIAHDVLQSGEEIYDSGQMQGAEAKWVPSFDGSAVVVEIGLNGIRLIPLVEGCQVEGELVLQVRVENGHDHPVRLRMAPNIPTPVNALYQKLGIDTACDSKDLVLEAGEERVLRWAFFTQPDFISALDPFELAPEDLMFELHMSCEAVAP